MEMCNKQFPFLCFFCMIPSAPFLWNNMFLLLEDQYKYFWQFLVARKLGIKTGLTESQLLSQGVQKPVFESLRYFLFGIYSVQSLFWISCCSNARVPRSSVFFKYVLVHKKKRLHSRLEKNCQAWRVKKNWHEKWPSLSHRIHGTPTFTYI